MDHQRGAEAEEACGEPCEEIRGAEAARCCSRAGGGEAGGRKRQAVVDLGRAADSAIVAMVGEDLGWDGMEAWRSGRWAAYPSCQAEVDHSGRVVPCPHEDHGETWEAAKVDGDDACREVDGRDLHEADKKGRAGSLRKRSVDGSQQRNNRVSIEV